MASKAHRIFITGANKGIGLATVAALVSASEKIHVILGSRSLERGRQARAELLERDGSWAPRITVLKVDVSDDDSVKAAAEKVASDFGKEPAPLRAIVNNAGVGSGDLRAVLNVNTWGPHRVVEAFLPLLDPEQGRIVNVASASGPNYVATCDEERKRLLCNPAITWEEIQSFMEKCLQVDAEQGDFAAVGLGDGNAYGISKACLNALTMHLARCHPNLVINACTPGFIETDMTRPYAKMRGITPQEMGMKAPPEGTRAALHLLLGEPGGSGWYFGSDAQRSPLDRYRAPGDPPFTGE